MTSARVLVVDQHQLIIDTLDAWLQANAPDLVVEDGWRAVPFAQDPAAVQPPAWLPAGKGAAVAILGTLDHHSELIPAVKWLIAAGFRVVVLAATADGWEAGAAMAAGAHAYVPKSAGPVTIEGAIRAAVDGQQYLHPEAAGVILDTPPQRVKLSPREQRLAQLYLGADALSVRGVADALDISEQTVKAHLHRIRQRYAAAGIKVGNVISMRKQLHLDGWIT